VRTTSAWARLRKWMAHASLRQRWCGLTTGHSYTGVRRTPPHLAFAVPGSRNVQREVWFQWCCRRCSFTMMGAIPEEVLVADIYEGPSLNKPTTVRGRVTGVDHEKATFRFVPNTPEGKALMDSVLRTS